MKTKVVGMLLSLFLMAVSPVTAQEEVFRDDFNDGDFSDWTVQRSMQWQRPHLPCMNGPENPAQWEILDSMLGITIQSWGCTTEITPNNLDLTDALTYELEFDWLFKESHYMDRNVLFAWQDASSWLGVKVLDQTVLLQKVLNNVGYGHTLIDNSVIRPHFAGDRVYHFKIKYEHDQETNQRKIFIWVDGTLWLVSREVGSFLEGFKTAGLQASVGAISRSASYFDNFIVRVYEWASSDVKLSLPHYKQTDPAWQAQEYDHATAWSDNPTINRWGCALTSLAMVMQYHGIEIVPDGSALTPETLNTWLKAQPDGYIGEGLLNWIAATRLTQLVSQQRGSSKLEFSYSADTSWATTMAELEKKLPSILQIEGHFLTAHGYTTDKSDVYIQDPAYAYQKFSEHETALLSSRLFRPSQTDLSYLLLAHDAELQVMTADWQVAEEWMTDTEKQNSTKKMKLQYQAKPTSGMYTFSVVSDVLRPFTVDVVAYDTQANPTMLKQEGWVGSEPIEYQLQYEREGVSSIKALVDFARVRRDLKALHQTKALKSRSTYLTLDRIARLGEETTSKTRQLRYAQSLRSTLGRYERSFTPDGFGYARQQTAWLESSLKL